MTASTDRTVPTDELDRRRIRRTDYVNCAQAFIDCKTPGSETKENYSIIGPGVTQNAAQVVNLREPHGFNIGAAAMPTGVVNNLHLHFTAEVFYNFHGDWQLRWGVDGTEGEYLCRHGDVVSIPTWVFRGFTNVGPADGWLFTALGFDDTGGIVWAPSVLDEAARHGLYLTAENTVLDTGTDPRPLADVELMPAISAADVARLQSWTAEQMRARVVTQADLRWSSEALLCHALPGGGAELALAIGYGMTEDRVQVPPIHYPHNFTAAWLRAVSGEGVLTHRHDAPQALVVHAGRWRVVLNEGDDEVATEIGPADTLSVPAGAWRRFEALTDDAQLFVVNGGDGRIRLEWAARVRAQARAGGIVHDAAGYVAPLSVVRSSALDD